MGKPVTFRVVIRHPIRVKMVEKQLNMVATFFIDEAQDNDQRVRESFNRGRK